METADESLEPKGDGVGSLSNFYKLETWDDAKYLLRRQANVRHDGLLVCC